MAEHRNQHRVVRRDISAIAWIALAAVAFVLCASASGQHPKRHDQFKHQVEKLEEAWRTAELNGDADAMAKLLSDDFVGISMTGQVVTKTQQLDRMRSQKMVLTRIDLTDMKVKLIGSTAIVTSLAEVEGTNDGAPIHGVFRYTRVYARQFSGTWKITNYEATRVGPPPPPEERRHPRTEDAKPE
ncbi:MAG: nuclear transport factor 2 family protein [Acidobacteriaceae bacterium]|nr:nuclear transport factor 2 family protein [Acidobacteriaceae bacterium]